MFRSCVRSRGSPETLSMSSFLQFEPWFVEHFRAASVARSNLSKSVIRSFIGSAVRPNLFFARFCAFCSSGVFGVTRPSAKHFTSISRSTGGALKCISEALKGNLLGACATAIAKPVATKRMPAETDLFMMHLLYLRGLVCKHMLREVDKGRQSDRFIQLWNIKHCLSLTNGIAICEVAVVQLAH